MVGPHASSAHLSPQSDSNSIQDVPLPPESGWPARSHDSLALRVLDVGSLGIQCCSLPGKAEEMIFKMFDFQLQMT